MDVSVIYQALGGAVATRRKELTLTQAQLATMLGMSRASIANIEAGRQKVLLHDVYRIADVLGLQSITQLVPQSMPRIEYKSALSISGSELSEKQLRQVNDSFMSFFIDTLDEEGAQAIQ